jgi:MoaA/NifB/PqqE/SkfB family radical SAM enzyme
MAAGLAGLGSGPLITVFFVTSRCNSRCKHCFDWQRRGPLVESRDLTLREIDAISRSLPRQYFMIVTGGEPFLREDIVDVVLAFGKNTRPRVLAIPSNGGQPEVILESVRRILRELPPEVYLSVNVSVDGVGGLHDELRGVSGLFLRARETLQGLSQLARGVENLGVGVVTVVSKYNQDHLDEIMVYVLDELRLSVWAPFLIRGHPRESQAADVCMERYAAISRTLEARIRSGSYPGYRGFLGARLNSAKNVVRRRLIQRTVAEGRRILPCSAGRLATAVYSDGSVFPCELRQDSMGNLRDFGLDWKRLWESPGAHESRRAVRHGDCFCTHENFLNMNIATSLACWPSLLWWTLFWGKGAR